MVKEPIDLHELTGEVISSHRQEAELAELRLSMNSRKQPIKIPGDRQRLQQLISNLLTNSIRYTDPGGHITITIKQTDSIATLEVQDSSPGVPDESLPRLFDRLYRVEQSRNRALGGAGLGLAICQQIVHAHEGSIAADHSPAGGLRIIVSIPLLAKEII